MKPQNMMVEKIIKRLDELFPLMKSTSQEIEESFKNIASLTDKTSQIQLGVKYDMLKAYVNSFFLLTDILEKDLETNLSSHSTEMSEFRDKLIEVQKIVKTSNSLEDILQKLKTNG